MQTVLIGKVVDQFYLYRPLKHVSAHSLLCLLRLLQLACGLQDHR